MTVEKLAHVFDKLIEWALYTVILSIPFSKSVVEISIIIGFIAWVAKKIVTKNYTLKKTALNNLLFAFFIITLVSFINAELKLLFMRSIVSKCLKYIALYFIIIETVDSDRKFKNLLTAALISAGIVMVDSFLQYYVWHYDFFHFYPPFRYTPYREWPTFEALSLGFPTGPFPFPNDLSAWMLIILIPTLALFIWGEKNKRAKLLLGAFLFPSLVLFYLANARGAWLGFFISSFWIIFMQAKKFFPILLIGLLVLTIVVLALPRDKTVHILGFTSLKDRVYMWRIGLEIFKEHPIIGNGLNMFFSEFKEHRDDEFKGKRGSYAHNGFLQMAAEIGIIGLGVFLLLIGTAFRSVFTYIRRSKSVFYRVFASGLSGGILAFLIHSFFDTNLQSLPLAVLFWFSLAVLMNISSDEGFAH